jgi:hypothetical protein
MAKNTFKEILLRKTMMLKNLPVLLQLPPLQSPQV